MNKNFSWFGILNIKIVTAPLANLYLNIFDFICFTIGNFIRALVDFQQLKATMNLLNVLKKPKSVEQLAKTLYYLRLISIFVERFDCQEPQSKIP